MKIAIGLSNNVIYDARLANIRSEAVISTLLEAYNDPEKDSVYLLTVEGGEVDIKYCGPPYDMDEVDSIKQLNLNMLDYQPTIGYTPVLMYTVVSDAVVTNEGYIDETR